MKSRLVLYLSKKIQDVRRRSSESLDWADRMFITGRVTAANYIPNDRPAKHHVGPEGQINNGLLEECNLAFPLSFNTGTG